MNCTLLTTNLLIIENLRSYTFSFITYLIVKESQLVQFAGVCLTAVSGFPTTEIILKDKVSDEGEISPNTLKVKWRLWETEHESPLVCTLRCTKNLLSPDFSNKFSTDGKTPPIDCWVLLQWENWLAEFGSLSLFSLSDAEQVWVSLEDALDYVLSASCSLFHLIFLDYYQIWIKRQKWPLP